MRIVCVGGGPAGLYFALLKKILSPDDEILVVERSGEGETYGLGLVFWGRLLTELRAEDPISAEQILNVSHRWSGQVVIHRGVPVQLTRAPGYGIARQALLEVLTKRARDVGVEIEFGREVTDIGEFDDADLIVASDGVSGVSRRMDSERLGTRVENGKNIFIWLGTSAMFDTFTFPYVETSSGWIWAHAYAVGDGLSTFIVECQPSTWSALGFDTLDPQATLRKLADIFSDYLDGAPLFAPPGERGATQWRQFREVTNTHWFDGKLVLIGDAAHTTHFTIGSGTRLAMGDSIALAHNLVDHADVESGLAAYEQQRQSEIAQLQRDANASRIWYESVSKYAVLPPEPFARLLYNRRSNKFGQRFPAIYSHLYKVGHMPVVRQVRTLFGSS